MAADNRVWQVRASISVRSLLPPSCAEVIL
jgi:hypothetical protein